MLKPEVVDRVIAAIKGYAQYEYFFDALKSPDWLIPLAERGLFKHPQPAEKVEQYIRFRFWPASRYLARMAKMPEAQADVLKIALEIPPSDNSRVYDDVAEIALSLPPESAARLVPKLLEGVHLPVKLLLKERLGDLIAYLADGGKRQAVNTLTRGSLALAPDPEANAKKEETFTSPSPTAYFEDFYYNRIVNKALPSVVTALGLGAVQIFADLLDDAIRLSRRAEDSTGEDYLYIPHPALEIGGGSDDVKATLLYAIRDASQRLLTANPGEFAKLIEILASKQWTSFSRLKLHLSRVFMDAGGLEIAESVFQQPDILKSASLHHEALLLLKIAFSRLSPETQERLLESISLGWPEEASRRWLEFSGQEITDQNIRVLSELWTRDHLALLQDQLPKDYQVKLSQLIDKIGPARNLEQPQGITGGAFQSVAPKPPQEFTSMTVAEAIEFLTTWTPGTDVFGPTAEGAAREFGAAIQTRPEEFLAVADAFKRLNPTYVRSLFTALTAALKEDRLFDWSPALDLAAWVSSQPRDIPGRKGGGLFVADPDWGWTRDAIIDLLSAGFNRKLQGNLPFVVRSSVWKVLEPLTQDPNPSPSDESPKKPASPVLRRLAADDLRDSEPDLTTISINTTRGRAMHAVFAYAEWVRVCLTESGVAGEAPKIDLTAMPEVREILEGHLDVGRDPTRTIRSIYGDHLTQLAILDWEWLVGNVARIFPLDDAKLPFFRAAWNSFVVFNYAKTPLLKLLASCYRRAIDRLGKDAVPRHAVRSPESALAEHLMTHYWHEALDFGSPEQLLEGFYELASDQVRGHAIWYVGVSVPGWKAEAPPEVYVRLQSLFDRRLEVARNAVSADPFSRELANFGYWFTSEKFDDKWSIERLLAALKLCKKVESDIGVAKRLAEICPQYPVECVECIRLMIEGDRDGWVLIGIEESAQALLGKALASNHPEASPAARRLVEALIGKGQFGFRTLL